jgi:hypothetical protein
MKTPLYTATELAIYQKYNRNPSQISGVSPQEGDASSGSRKTSSASQSSLIQTAKHQWIVLSSEEGQSDETPLWHFMGSPLKAGLLTTSLWGSMSLLASSVVGKLHGSRQLSAAIAGLGMLNAVSLGVLKYHKIDSQNTVYSQWIDALKNPQATLGDLHRYEK